MNYAAQWKDAAATFTASAHRHHAGVDLAIRLHGWRDWSEDATRQAAAAVDRGDDPQARRRQARRAPTASSAGSTATSAATPTA